MKYLLPIFLFATLAHAQCPGEDAEPAISVKTKEGPTIFLCGFEDHDVPSTKGKRAFADFAVYFESDKVTTPQKVFSAEPNETYWAKSIPLKGIELEELWFFSEKPEAAMRNEINCTAETCVASEAKCVLKMKANPFPKALGEFKKKSAKADLGDDGEELLDQIFAQAFNGDKAAKEFYAKEPAGLDPALAEAFAANKKKIDQGCKR